MLEKIKIKNFQSHIDTEVVPHKGITAITGSSDVGKTAIFRAINWLWNNRPLGNAFINKNSNGAVETTLCFDGSTVKRIKARGKNAYVVQGKKLDVVGSNVPEEVTNFLNLSDITIQGQHDNYFLLQNTSAGEVAKRLNKIAGFEIIDYVTKEVKSAITKNNSEIKYCQERTAELEDEIEKYKHLDSVEVLINELENLQKQQSAKKEEKEKIELLIEEIENAKEFINEISQWLEIKGPVSEIQDLLVSAEELTTDLNSIVSISDKIEATKNIIEECESIILIEDFVDDIFKLIDEYDKTDDSVDSLSLILANIATTKTKIAKCDLIIEERTKELETKLKKYKICPFCGCKLSKNAVEHIKNNF